MILRSFQCVDNNHTVTAFLAAAKLNPERAKEIVANVDGSSSVEVVLKVSPSIFTNSEKKIAAAAQCQDCGNDYPYDSRH